MASDLSSHRAAAALAPPSLSTVSQVTTPAAAAPSAAARDADSLTQGIAEGLRTLPPENLATELDSVTNTPEQRQAVVKELIKQTFNDLIQPHSELTATAKLQFLKAAIEQDQDPEARVPLLTVTANEDFLNELSWLEEGENFRALAEEGRAVPWTKGALNEKRAALIENMITPLLEHYAPLLDLPAFAISNVGTVGFSSDVDLTIKPAGEHPSVLDYIRCGRTALMATHLTRALIGSEHHLDLEFYGPHHAQYIPPPTADASQEAQNIYRRGELAGNLLQMRQLLTPPEFANRSTELIEVFANAGTSASAKQTIKTDLTKLVGDCAIFSDFLNGKEVSEDALSTLSKPMKTWCETLQSLPEGERKDAMAALLVGQMQELETDTEHLEQQSFAQTASSADRTRLTSDVLKNRMLTKFMATFFTACRPEGYNTGGAFDDTPGTLQPRTKRNVDALRAIVEEEDVSTQAEQAQHVRTQTVQSGKLSCFARVMAAIENNSYFNHREKLIDASKYGPRMLTPYRDALAERLLTLTASEDSAEKQEVTKLLDETDKLLEIMETMESVKREYVDRHFAVLEIASMPRQKFNEALKQLSEEDKTVICAQTTLNASVNKLLDIVCADNPVFDAAAKKAISDAIVQLPLREKRTLESAFRGHVENPKKFITSLVLAVMTKAQNPIGKIESAVQKVLKEFMKTVAPQSGEFVLMGHKARVTRLSELLKTKRYSETQIRTCAETALAVSGVAGKTLSLSQIKQVQGRSAAVARQRIESFKEEQGLSRVADEQLKEKCNELCWDMSKRVMVHLIKFGQLPVPQPV